MQQKSLINVKQEPKANLSNNSSSRNRFNSRKAESRSKAKAEAKATANQSDTPIYYLNIYTQFVPSQNQYEKLYDICMLFYSHSIGQVEIGSDRLEEVILRRL